MIQLVEVEAQKCTCNKCSHKWITVARIPPAICPACRSRQWNGEKRHGRPPSIESRIELPKPKRVRL
jgi:Zn finger protein HypA/HybF involved in hydrogenase expression